MRTEKSRLRRSLTSLQECMRQIRHFTIGNQVGEINAFLRGHYAYYGVAGNYRCTGSRSVTGTGCYVAAARPGAASPGTCSTRSKSGRRYCNQSCASLIGSCRLLQCCEPTAEERSAGNPHATFCGNRRRATGSRDPVPRVKFLGPTRHRAAQFEDAFARFLPPEPNIRTLKRAPAERRESVRMFG